MAPTARSIATVLFTDIVGSTERAMALGDRRWRELLARHHEVVRGWIQRYGGQEVGTAGDGFLALFDGPTSALLCAASIRDALRELELEIRAGVHMGEVQREGGNVSGVSVHIGSRVAALAGPGEILVSSTVRDAETGSDFAFEDRGRHTVCARMTAEFLAFSRARGNDLSTPRPEFGFPGLRPGDRWCLCADRWREAWEAGMAPKVVLASTHLSTLEVVPLDVLMAHAMPGRAPYRH